MTPASDVPALEVRHLTVSYGGRPALWDVDAHFPRAALSAVVGPNGSGKSTLLNACLGLTPADAGQITILGAPARAARARVAYVPQREAVDWDFPITVREVVEMGRYRAAGWVRRIGREDRRIVADALERLGMAPFARRQIGQLSGGQRQRVFVARALAQQAELMVMDEPFAGIDARTEAAILTLLRELRDREGRSIVVVHHDLTTVRSVFDWALLLNTRAVACGPIGEAMSPENVRRAYGSSDLGALAAAPGPAGAGEDGPWAG
jgi:manganese/zinc/iron transport system ATP- binding protein